MVPGMGETLFPALVYYLILGLEFFAEMWYYKV